MDATTMAATVLAVSASAIYYTTVAAPTKRAHQTLALQLADKEADALQLQRQIDRVRLGMTTLVQENNSLKERIASQEAECARARDANARMEKELQVATAATTKWSSALEESQAKCIDATLAGNLLEEQLAQTQHQLAQEMDQLTMVRNQLEVEQLRHQAAVQELQQVAAQLVECQAAVQLHQAEIRDLVASSVESQQVFNQRLADLTEALASKQAMVDSQADSLRLAETTLDSKTANEHRQADEICRLSEELEARDAKLEAIAAAMVERDQTLTAVKSELGTKVVELSAALSAAAEEKEELVKLQAATVADHERILAEVEGANKQLVQQLNETIAAAKEAHQSAVADAEQQLTEYKRDAEQRLTEMEHSSKQNLADQLANKQAEAERRLANELARVQQEFADRLQAKDSELEAKLAQVEQDHATKLKETLAQAEEKLFETMSTAAAESEALLSQKVSEANAEADRKVAAVESEASTQIQQLRQLVDGIDKDGQVAELQRQVQAADERADRISAQWLGKIKQLSADKADLEQKLAAALSTSTTPAVKVIDPAIAVEE